MFVNQYCAGRRLAVAALFLAPLLNPVGTPPAHAVEDRTVTVFDRVPIDFNAERPEAYESEDGRRRLHGQIVERTVRLPDPPRHLRDARRVTATIIIEPRLIEGDRGVRPGDPWTRLGSINLVLNEVDSDQRAQFGHDERMESAPATIELVRFITPFGGPSVYTADLTPLAPMLHGDVRLQALIDTYANPGWALSLKISFEREGVGFRRPAFAAPLFFVRDFKAERPTVRSRVRIPEGLDRPRLRMITSGHATDGRGGDEFVTRTHTLRINGEVVARWRPWSENGGQLRELNPTSGRFVIGGREVWSSDLDRSGWHPGLEVEPTIVPLPELTPGEHEIELSIRDIRPPDPDDPDAGYGYWRISAIVVADEPWPQP